MPLPKFKLPPGAKPPVAREDTDDRPMTAEERAQALKIFADARGALAVDENGAPVRRYLSEPPTDYRLPDPTAPVEFAAKPKNKLFRWPWAR